jgi:hypothetical protein
MGMPVSTTWPQLLLTRGGYPLFSMYVCMCRAMIFFGFGWRIFPIFLENILEKEYNIILQFPCFFGTQFSRKRKENPKEQSKLSQFAYYMNGCLIFFYFHVFEYCQILANYTYGGSPLEQHHKTEKTT